MSESRPPIFFARHGETDWNRERRIQGLTDVPLNSLGHAQARAVARGLRNHVGAIPVDRFIVSPLLRARQSMRPIAEAFGLPEERVEIEPVLAELGFGVWEGRTFDELHADPATPKTPLERFHWRPERGESYVDGVERLNRWIDRIDGPAVVVAHGAIGRCLIGLMAGLGPEELVKTRMPQGRFCRLTPGRAAWFDAIAEAA